MTIINQQFLFKFPFLNMNISSFFYLNSVLVERIELNQFLSVMVHWGLSSNFVEYLQSMFLNFLIFPSPLLQNAVFHWSNPWATDACLEPYVFSKAIFRFTFTHCTKKTIIRRLRRVRGSSWYSFPSFLF